MITEAHRLAEHNLKTLSENDYPGRGVLYWAVLTKTIGVGFTGLWGGAQTVVTDV